VTTTTGNWTEGVDHVGLTVRNLEQSKSFFCDCLGWSVWGEKPSYPAVFITDGVSRVTLWQVESSDNCVDFDRRKNVGLHHLALKVGDIDTLQRLFARVTDWPGVEVEFAPELLGTGPKTHCMIREPGGTRIEFACLPQS
jgi:catechol 2,3-dioxygenase-like lactoylglutathione lyase family enzyme